MKTSQKMKYVHRANVVAIYILVIIYNIVIMQVNSHFEVLAESPGAGLQISMLTVISPSHVHDMIHPESTSKVNRQCKLLGSNNLTYQMKTFLAG